MSARYMPEFDTTNPWPRYHERNEPTPEELQVPVHEATHCAVFAGVGWKIDYATTIPEGDMRGHVTLLGIGPWDHFQRLVGDVSAHVAEEDILGIYRHAGDAMDTGDLVHARQQATLIDAENWAMVYEGAKKQARKFVKANRQQILALADLLFRHQKIWGKHIEMKLAQLPPLRAVPKKWSLPLRPPPPLAPSDMSPVRRIYTAEEAEEMAASLAANGKVVKSRTAEYFAQRGLSLEWTGPDGIKRFGVE